MDRLSYFKPYKSKEGYHEDPLTRAYLVVLRFVPAAFGSFLDLVREQQSVQGSDPEDRVPNALQLDPNAVTLETQVATPGEINSRWLSLLLTDQSPDKTYSADWVDREPRYDAVLSFGDWTLIAENKPHVEDVWSKQLCPRPVDIEDVKLAEHVVVLQWPDIVERLINLARTGHVSRAERMMIEDFLAYLNENHSHLNPYRKFSLCGEDLELVNRRCKQIMEELAVETDSSVHYHHGFGHQLVLQNGIVARAALYCSEEAHDKNQIWLGLWPADTVNQSRDFYKKVNLNAINKLIGALPASPGWNMETNFHFSFMQQNLYYPTWVNKYEDTAELHLDPRRYMQYWQTHIGDIRQYSRARDEIESLFEDLREVKLVTDTDIRRLRELYLETRRHHVNLCPGMCFWHNWPRKEADRLDDLDEFIDDVKLRLKEILACWGQTFPA